MDHDYVSGAGDAAYYVGECRPCRATLHHVTARLSAVGYSGTNASGALSIRDSLWDRNGAGIVPTRSRTRQTRRRGPRRSSATASSARAARACRSTRRSPASTGSGSRSRAATGPRRATVTGSSRYGVAVFRTDYWIALDPRAAPPGSRSGRPGTGARQHRLRQRASPTSRCPRGRARWQLLPRQRGPDDAAAGLQSRPCARPAASRGCRARSSVRSGR